jgi:hypothetical protein
MAGNGLDAVVLTNQHDVRHATGYTSVLERWDLYESLAVAAAMRDSGSSVILEIPVGFPSYGLNGGRGVTIEENMTLGLYCLYFGGKPGPCHMEDVYITGRGEPEPTYAAPLEVLGPRDI